MYQSPKLVQLEKIKCSKLSGLEKQKVKDFVTIYDV